MKRILLLGATGFLGGHILKGFENCTDLTPIVPERAIWDLNDQDSLRAVFEDTKPDIVVNMAAISSTGAEQENLYRVNAFGHLNVLEALDKVGFQGRLVYFSSSNVYGAVRDEVVSETTRPLPINHYSCAKLLAENYCSMFAEKFETVIVRPFSIIGPGQKDYFLLPKLARHFAQNADVIELGNVNVAKDFVDARDLCKMLVHVLRAERTAPLINFANGEAVSLKALFDIFSNLSGHRPEIHVNPEFVRPRDILYQCGDNQLIRSLGYRRDHSIDDTVAWIFEAQLKNMETPK